MLGHDVSGQIYLPTSRVGSVKGVRSQGGMVVPPSFQLHAELDEGCIFSTILDSSTGELAEPCIQNRCGKAAVFPS